MIPLALAAWPTTLVCVVGLLTIAFLARADYRRICRRDATRRLQRQQPQEEWPWPVKLAGPESRTRLPL